MSDDRLSSLKQALYHDSASTRRNAITEIAALDTPAVVPVLVDTLADPSPDVRAAAAEALAGLAVHHPVDVLPLTKLLADSADRVREATAHALTAVGSAAVPELLHVLADDSSSTVRGAAADILGDIADTQTVEPLQTAYSADHSMWVRSRAHLALGKLGVQLPPPTPPTPSARPGPTIRDTNTILKAGGTIEPPPDPIELIRQQTQIQWPSLNNRPSVGEGSMLDAAREMYEPPTPQQPSEPSPAAKPSTPTAADIQAMLDQLDVRLATGEISEATYKRLVTRWEARLNALSDD